MHAPSTHPPNFLSRLPAPRRVALLRASRIGDLVCATPALRALRAALPQAEITLVALPLVADMAARLPYLDRFVPFPGFPGIAEQFFDARTTLRFFQEMQAECFDLAVQMHGSGSYSNPAALMLGARTTVGFVRDKGDRGRLDAGFPIPHNLHEIDKLLALTAFLGAPGRGRQPEFPLWPDDRAVAGDLVAGLPLPLVGIHPGAREGSKRWALGRFAALARAIQQRHGGSIVVIGGTEEKPAGREIGAALHGPCLDLTGAVTLPVLGAVMEHLAVLVTNDSGPAHIAYAVGIPTVTVFGGTDPATWGPPRDTRHRLALHAMPCRPCGHDACPVGYGCLGEVSVEEVMAQAEDLLATTHATHFAAG